MNDITIRIKNLEDMVTDLKKELRRIKSAIKKVENLGLITPPEILVKKEDIETILKDYKQELKALKKVVKLIN